MRRISQRACRARPRWLVAPYVAAALLALAAAPASAGTIRDDRDPQLYLNLGAAPEYASVGKFDLTKYEPGFSASGTLIADNWVLTAAHVMDGTASGQFTVGGRAYAVSTWVTHPKWDNALRRGYDLALVKLSGTVSNVAPASLYTGHQELGATATFVGFGRTGTGLSGYSADFDGLKRAGTNTIDGTLGPEPWPLPATFRNKLPRSARTFVADFDNPHDVRDNVTGPVVPTDLEYLISLGDSGGGAFADFGRGPQLVGVHSFAEIPDGVDNSDYGDVIGDVRVSAFAKWIRTTIKHEEKVEAAALRREQRLANLNARRADLSAARILSPESVSALPADMGASAVPEPVSAILLVPAVALMLRRRRRST